jgi:transposase-like protein
MLFQGMKTLTELFFLKCQLSKTKPFKKYSTVHNSERHLLKCNECGNIFSETIGTPIQDIKSPLSKLASVLKICSEGMRLRSTGRVLGIPKKTVSKCEYRFGEYYPTPHYHIDDNKRFSPTESNTFLFFVLFSLDIDRWLS